jgi:hypothetical protein
MGVLNGLRKNCSGSSLAELLMVVALISLLSAAAIPALRSQREKKLLEATAGTIAMHMRMAQGHAVATQTTGRLVFYTFSDIYYVELSGEREWVYLPEEISIVAINFALIYNRRELSFNMLGVPNQGGHMSLKNARGEKIYIIITPATGRVRVSRDPPG